MGDRANIVINCEGGRSPRVFFYTHWDGSSLPKILQSALKRGKSRWDDEPYLARIIFNEMTERHSKELTGYGISTYLCDNSYDLLVVDSGSQQVWLENEEQTMATSGISFDDFCALELSSENQWQKLKNALGSLISKNTGDKK